LDGDWVLPHQDGTTGYLIEPEDSNPTIDEPQEMNVSSEPPNDSDASVGQGRLRKHDPFDEGRGDSATAPEVRPRRRRAGGFTIDWDNGGRDAPRSNYIESELIILINLDHPEIAAAYSAGDSSPLFRMLVFEAALQEYSYATAYQQLDEDTSMDGADALQYVRQTIDLLSREVAEVVVDLNWLPTPTLQI
jgi:hypothetical protein